MTMVVFEMKNECDAAFGLKVESCRVSDEAIKCKS